MKNYGQLNGHLIGVAMKEMVRRAIHAIREQRFIFEAKAKPDQAGEMKDLVTSADFAAQTIYCKMMQEMFPTFGIIAEEDNLLVQSTSEIGNIYFTVDPLDGTKAFARRQSHGIGTMVSLVLDNQVIAAYIGDVTTQEVYGYRPESDHVYRISEYDRAERLSSITKPPHEGILLLRGRPEDSGVPILQVIANDPKHANPGAFRYVEITSGSIGISMARLWKGEVSGALLDRPKMTPWDDNPIIGISEKLGFIFLMPNTDGTKLIRWMPRPVMETTGRSPVLVIHRNHLPHIEEWNRMWPGTP